MRIFKLPVRIAQNPRERRPHSLCFFFSPSPPPPSFDDISRKEQKQSLPLCHRLPAHVHARKGEHPALLLLGISLTLRVLQHSMFALLAERAGWGFDKDEQKSLASSSAMYVPQRKHLSKKAKAAAKARCQGEHAVGLASSPSSFALSCSLPPLTVAPFPADDLVQISLHQPARTWTSPA